MVLPTKKQYDYPTIYQLYQHYKSPKRESRDFFQNILNQLSTKPLEVCITLAKIRDEGILNLENFSFILIHPLPIEIGDGLIQLHNSNLLNTKNKKALEKHISPTGIALVLRLLQSVKLLTSENRIAIQEKDDPHSIASVLFTLYYADLFTQRNFDSVLALTNLIPLINTLRGYNRQNILTQTKFDQLICTQQEKNSQVHDLNEFRKIIIPKQIFHSSIFSYPTNFFQLRKCRHDPEPRAETIEFNKQICKN